MKSRTNRRKRISKSRSARRPRSSSLSRKIMSFFKGGRMLVSRFASIAF